MAWKAAYAIVLSSIVAAVVIAPGIFGSTPDSAASAISTAKIVQEMFRDLALGWGCSGIIIALVSLGWPTAQFGDRMSSLYFPAIMGMMSACFGVSVVAHAYLHPWPSGSSAQRSILVLKLAGLANLLIFLVFAPKMLQRIEEGSNKNTISKGLPTDVPQFK